MTWHPSLQSPISPPRDILELARHPRARETSSSRLMFILHQLFLTHLTQPPPPGSPGVPVSASHLGWHHHLFASTTFISFARSVPCLYAMLTTPLITATNVVDTKCRLPSGDPRHLTTTPDSSSAGSLRDSLALSHDPNGIAFLDVPRRRRLRPQLPLQGFVQLQG